MSEPTIWIALYAAVLSTIIGVHTLRKERRRLKVTCAISLVPDPHNDGVLELVDITAINPGSRPVSINAAGLSLSNGNAILPREHAIGPYPLPKKLEDGESVSLLIRTSHVREALKEVGEGVRLTKAFVRDAEGKKHQTRVPKFVRQVLNSTSGD